MQKSSGPSHRQPAIPQQLAICVQPSTELKGGVCLQRCLRWCLGAAWGGLLHMPRCISTPDMGIRNLPAFVRNTHALVCSEKSRPKGSQNGKHDFLKKGL